MIRIEITVESTRDLYNELATMLRGLPSGAPERAEVKSIALATGYCDPVKITPDEAVAVGLSAKELTEATGVPVEVTGISNIQPAPQSTPEQPKKRPGRPRKELAPAGAPVAETSAPSVPASQPAVEENTGSVQPAATNSPVGDAVKLDDVAAGEAQAPAATPPSKPVTDADMRAALQAYNTKIGGDEGLLAVSEVLAKFGYQKVSAVQPEHFGPIAAEAASRLAAISQEN